MISAKCPWTATPLLNARPPNGIARPWKLGSTYWGQRSCRKTPLVFAQSLAELEGHDPDCVIYVRGVHRLGFDSEKVLRKHYGQFGKVEKILLSNMHELPPGSKRARLRVRPSSIALILLAHPEEASMALAAGDVQIVDGVPINVRKFVHKDLRESVCSPSSIVPDQLDQNSVVQFASSGRGETDMNDTSSESTSVGAECNADDTRSSSSSFSDNLLVL